MTATNNIIQIATSRAKIKLANSIKDYEEMAVGVKELVECQPELNKDEFEWLSIAYTHCIKTRHVAWTEMKITLDKEKESGNDEIISATETKLKEIESEMLSYCADVLHLLEKKILPNINNNSLKVLCYKLMGDHNRFLAELETSNAEYDELHSFSAYQNGYELASRVLHITCPEYLSLILNYSQFVYEVLEEKEKAKDMVINVRNAVARQAGIKEPSKDALDILTLLNENLLRWGVTEDVTETEDSPSSTSTNSNEEELS
ncbi:14-3-3 family protein artA-like [Teleopsis dalmanni]|uniref:14-3-3 family protein artA-like n=1 Tax=Teleopsis dalmanni TaxID=139649 RepID=UPI0018CDB272|nr:14-3-3 family protein artA-like [Teleopsis dalmanni]